MKDILSFSRPFSSIVYYKIYNIRKGASCFLPSMSHLLANVVCKLSIVFRSWQISGRCIDGMLKTSRVVGAHLQLKRPFLA